MTSHLFLIVMVQLLILIFLTGHAIKNGRWMKEMLRTIHVEGEQRHKEVVEQMAKMDERAEQRHQEVIELLKKGFGELIQRRAT